MLRKSTYGMVCVLCTLCSLKINAQSVQTSVRQQDSVQVFTLANDQVTQDVFIRHGQLIGDKLSGNPSWLDSLHSGPAGVWSDGDFLLKMMWTAWSAPGKQTNADVQVAFSKKDYVFKNYDFKNAEEGGKLLELYFYPKDRENTIQLRITYQLLPNKFYSRRQIAVRDTIKETNWLDTYFARKGVIKGSGAKRQSPLAGEENRIVKKGAFGQPAAVDFASGGVFFGVEYPSASTFIARKDKKHLALTCKEVIGTVVKNQWVDSKWIVEGLSPNQYVKQWFFKYLPDIRVAPNRPYALYNSWYDLRSPAFKNVAPEHIMNEKNIMTIIDQFKKNMIDPYGIHLDAFVLDDGWDVHQSDWQLDKKTFPHGLKPISNALDKLGTTLGIWYGPTGGYSFRNDRINWMRDHGYEVSGQGNDAMLCIGGKNYSALFQKRTTDMVKNGGVGYFKWDGIQFSCSDPTHGHPIGYYSRRAILDSMIAKSKAVRAVNPNVFLNITSGTWLSPWWMEYANQIWMQGGDYGFADIPSVNQRDASMTYKDIVLYNDFHNLDEWFPISNLMTHGIIKGTLNEIGGTDDPLSKFTDDAMFYFGRGVTMYELYISPDLLNKQEWIALSKSLKWAENRFPVLENTDMIGGAPAKGEAYGYVHFKKNKGVIALRNPGMKEQQVQVTLNPKFGMDPEARSLVLERVYPTHWISPDLYAAGATVSLPLTGYETAIYEVYPLDSAHKPLIAGVTFNVDSASDANQYAMDVLQAGSSVKVLNPEEVTNITVNGQQQTVGHISLPAKATQQVLTDKNISFSGADVHGDLSFSADAIQPRVVIFLHPDSTSKGKALPEGVLSIDGKKVDATIQHQKGIWSVYSYVLPGDQVTGKHTFDFTLTGAKNPGSWKGTADAWIITQQKQTGETILVKSAKKIQEKPVPPSPYEKGAMKKNIDLGSGTLSL